MKVKNVGKTIVLLLLVIILTFLGLLWFDYLGVISAKTLLNPVYKLIGLEEQVSETVTNVDKLLELDLDEDRFSKRLEELSIRSEELDKREADIATQEAQITQISQELDDRRISQEEREKTFNNVQKKYDDRNVNIEKNARNLNAMPPDNAVAILLQMDIQDVIDTLRKVDEIAEAEGGSSLVSYWLQLMPADRAAEISTKMASKPLSLD